MRDMPPCVRDMKSIYNQNANVVVERSVVCRVM